MTFRAPFLHTRSLLLPTFSLSLLVPLVRPSPFLACQPLRCDAPKRPFTYSPVGNSRGGLNGEMVRQVSTGSILGLFTGAAVAYLSKPLAILIGIFVVAAQYLEYNGIHVIPYNTFQRYFKSVDLRSLVSQNPAMKLSFGVMFAMAGFGSL